MEIELDWQVPQELHTVMTKIPIISSTIRVCAIGNHHEKYQQQPTFDTAIMN